MIPDDLIAGILEREGGYTNHPADRGGPTNWGITEVEARAHGYAGDMRDFPKDAAVDIYRHKYWSDPGFNQVALRSVKIAEELLDTGVNMGPTVAAKFLQRALNVLNRGASAYPDVSVDGNIGKMTLYALDQFIAARGQDGISVLLKALNGLQAARYIEIAEANPSQEAFAYGWLKERVA